MTNPLVSFCIITRDRKDELLNALNSIVSQRYRPIEIILVDDNSVDNTVEIVQRFIQQNPSVSVEYLRNEISQGVAPARNKAMAAARGDFLVVIDDDAALIGEDNVAKLVNKFFSDDSIGILSFKIADFSLDNIPHKRLPSRFRNVPIDTEWEAAYYNGCGHAIRREVIRQLGGYKTNVFYGAEELDLAYRVLDAGYKILYFPEVRVLHTPSQTFRVDKAKKWRATYKNRVLIAVRYLPWRYVFSSAVIWLGLVSIKSRNPLYGLWGLLDVFRELRITLADRQPLSWKTVKKMDRLGGRLWY